MDNQIWTIKALINGNFFLVNKDALQTTEWPHPNVRGLLIKPHPNEEKKSNGLFDLDIKFIVENDNAPEIADLGRNILDIYINLLTFLSGCPVNLAKDPYLTYDYTGTNKHRTISFGKTVNMPPAVPLLNKDILSTKLEKKYSRIITWLRKGIEESDPINSLLSLYVALEILSDQFTCNEKRNRECEKCGYINEMEAGTRQKVHNLLINVVGYDEKQFESIWENTRNKIIHGGLDITAEIKRDFQKTKNEIVITVLKGVKKLLNIPKEDPPNEAPLEFFVADAFTDIQHETPKK